MGTATGRPTLENQLFVQLVQVKRRDSAALLALRSDAAVCVMPVSDRRIIILLYGCA